MQTNPTLESGSPNVPSQTHPSDDPGPKGEPVPEFPAANAEPSAGASALPEAAAVLPAAKSDSLVPGLRAEIQKLKSDVPEIGVLGVTETLSDAEYIKLLTYEEVVAMAHASWFEAGRALTQIRDQELWRGAYPGFDEYCVRRWQFGRSKVYYLMGAASVCDTLKTVPGLPVPEFESQLRALVRLAPEKRIEAWQGAARRAGARKITGAMVRAAAQAVQAPAEPDAKRSERRRELLARRRQTRELMSELLELIMGRRPYEELIQKAAALDAQVRFFFPPPRKR